MRALVLSALLLFSHEECWTLLEAGLALGATYDEIAAVCPCLPAEAIAVHALEYQP